VLSFFDSFLGGQTKVCFSQLPFMMLEIEVEKRGSCFEPGICTCWRVSLKGDRLSGLS